MAGSGEESSGCTQPPSLCVLTREGGRAGERTWAEAPDGGVCKLCDASSEKGTYPLYEDPAS